VKDLRKILIIQTAFIGDVILATALIEKLRSHYPESKLHFLLRKGNESLLVDHPHLDKVIVFNKMKGKYINLIKIIREIRKEKYDLAVNIQRYFTTGLITTLSGARNTIGFSKNPFSFMFSKKIRHSIDPIIGKHEIDRNQELIAHITDTASAKPKLYPTSDHLNKVELYKSSPYVCIAPASIWYTKQWPKEKWISFIDQIPNDIIVWLIGSKEDGVLCDQIILQANNKKTKSLAGSLNLLESAALMKDAMMNFVNDSAPMHLASAVNAPLCTIYCSTVPGFGFGPLSGISEVIQVDEELTCRPCGLHGHRSCPEGHFKCANDISEKKIKEVMLMNLNIR